MKKLNKQEIKKIVYDCEKATFLIEKQLIGTITIDEKLQLQLHLKGCEVCTIYQKQSALINQYVKNLMSPEHNELKLDDGFKEELQKSIDKQLDKK